MLTAYPTCLEFCLKKKKKPSLSSIVKSGSESRGGERVNQSPEDGEEPPGIHSTGGPCWGLVFTKCDHRAGQRKFSRNAQVCLDFIQDSHSPLG